MDDVIPFVQRTYRVDTDKAQRAIAGLSMGAGQTVIATNNNPNLFDYIGVFSGGGRVGDPEFEKQLAEIKKDKVKLYWTGAGDIDFAAPRNRCPGSRSESAELSDKLQRDSGPSLLVSVEELPRGLQHPDLQIAGMPRPVGRVNGDCQGMYAVASHRS